MFMSKDYATTWRTLKEPRAPTLVEDPSTWHEYASRPSEIPG